MHTPTSLRVFTSWPQERGAGSGTTTFLDGFCEGLESCGIMVQRQPHAPLASIDYRSQLTERIAINAAWSALDLPPEVPFLALDWDGYALTSAQRAGRQVIVSPRGLFADLAPTEPDLRAELGHQAALEQQNLAACDWCFVASHYAKRKLQQYYAVPPERIAVLPNGISPSFLSALAAAESFDWPRPTILAVAKFYPRKNIPTLVRAFAQLRSSGIDAGLCLVGDGFEAPLVRALIAEHKLAEWVQWPGVITDPALLARYYRSCTVFCHPSGQETFGNVVLEALAAGKPVIVADAASLPEVADELGMYVPPGDAESLALALESALAVLAGDPTLQAELGERAVRRAAGFTWTRTAERFIACCNAWEATGKLPSEVL